MYPRVPPFWEKIAYVSIFYKISSCEQKKERDLSRKYKLQRKKSSTYTQRGRYWSFMRHKYLYPSVPSFWEIFSYVRISWKKFTLLSRRRTWLVTQRHVITKKTRHTLKGTIVVFHTTLIFISQCSTVLR